MKKILALMYDFDKTLCTKDMQEYTFIPDLEMSVDEFWSDANKLRENDKMDQVLTYMYLISPVFIILSASCKFFLE